MNLDFVGRVRETKLSTLDNLVVLSRTAYDRGGRTKSVCQQVFNPSTPENGKYWESVGRYGYNGIANWILRFSVAAFKRSIMLIT